MILVLGKSNCIYCDNLKRLLESRSVPYRYINVSLETEYLTLLMEKGLRTVPQAFSETETEGLIHIGDYSFIASNIDAVIEEHS